MREAFHDELGAVFTDLATISSAVQTQVSQATRALLTGDSNVAEQVISADAEIDRAAERVEDHAFSLLSLQAPVAGDLRMVVAALRMVSELERMGDLSVHVAKIARLRVPVVAVPQEIQPTMRRMAHVAEEMVGRLTRLLEDRDIDAAEELRAMDDEMDRLRATTFVELLAEDWPHGVEAAIDIALLGRYYERIADHAVSVATRIIYIVTGHVPTTA